MSPVRLAAALLLACTAAAANPPAGNSEEWADTQRQAATDAVPYYQTFTEEARALAQDGWTPFSPFPQVLLENGTVRAFDWASGSWREADQASWLAGEPIWHPIFALSTVNEDRQARFFPRPWNNLLCAPSGARCMIAITSGGFDAVRWLEIDTNSQAIPPEAFDLPPSRASLAWLDEDTLLVTAGVKSASGYPLEARRWRRGEALQDAGQVFAADNGADALFVDSAAAPTGRIGLLTFNSGTDPVRLIAIGARTKAIRLPAGFVQGSAAGQLAILLTEDWRNGGRAYKVGTLLSFDLAALARGRVFPPEIIYAPTDSSGIGSPKTSSAVLPIRDAFYFTVLRDGGQGIWRAKRLKGRWQVSPVLERAGATATLISADPQGLLALASLESPVDSPALYRLDGAAPDLVRSTPSLFDAADLVVEQREAAAGGGTTVPYWLVRQANKRGPQPTIIHAYGADGIPLLPAYDAAFGRLWLQRGGAYAIAQVRGGGEFGPEWQAAGSSFGMGAQVNDVISIAEDLVRSGRAIPATLGLFGRSAGGWLAASAATLRPDLFAAAVSQDGAVDPENDASAAGSPVIREWRRLLDSAEGRKIADTYWPARAFNRERGCPNLLLTSWRGDQRVPATQSRSLAALHRNAGCATLLFEQDGGEHGVVSPELLGLTFGYFAWRLALPLRTSE